MAWSALGSLTPTLLDWVTLNAPAQGELFSVTQDWVGEWPGTGYIRARMLYADNEFYEDGIFESLRFYASREERLIYLPFNPALQAAGYNVRYFQARLNMRARTYAGANWQINFAEFITDAEADFAADGGVY
jgi:hypothetical protein